MGSLSPFASMLISATLLGVLVGACAQSRGLTPAFRDSVIIGVADTGAHLYRGEPGNGRAEPTRSVIRNQRALNELWSTLQAHVPPPRVDFSQKDVLVARFGVHGSTGRAISIDTVLTGAAQRIVVVRVTAVNEDCLVGSALTYPVDIVVVPHESTRTTRFVERTHRLPGCVPSPRPIRR